jgi:TonB family protein
MGKRVSVVMQIPIKFQMQKATPEKPVASTENPKGPYYNSDDIPLHVVEKQPEYKGGYDAMMNFLKKNIKYPETAKKSGIQGTVYIQFIVEKTGKISKVRILRGISKECDEEAIRVVNSMPKWIPGRQDGKAVPVMFQIPVKFQLDGK